MNLSENTKIDINKVIAMTEIDPRRIWNIYLYGSRVYNTAYSDSDWDFKVIASTVDKHREYNDGTYNVHVWTTDSFKDDLWNHKMSALECIYAPSFAKIQEKTDHDFIINRIKLKKTCMSESYASWNRGRMKLLDGDIYRGHKSLFHSLRMLMFGLQILEHGKIVDFSEANHFKQEIDDFQSLKWDDFKKGFLPRKKKLEELIHQA